VVVPTRNTGTKTLYVIIAILIGVIVALCATFLAWKDDKGSYKAIISGFAAFAATVLSAIAVEQALGVLG
jgi:hypothetical protein